MRSKRVARGREEHNKVQQQTPLSAHITTSFREEQTKQNQECERKSARARVVYKEKATLRVSCKVVHFWVGVVASCVFDRTGRRRSRAAGCNRLEAAGGERCVKWQIDHLACGLISSTELKARPGRLPPANSGKVSTLTHNYHCWRPPLAHDWRETNAS